MKIYFAYRDVYKDNNRFIKEFEANSILDFFQKNWQTLGNDDQYAEFLGNEVYGFPLSYYEGDKEASIPPVPNSFEELAENLQNYVYSNEVLANPDCIQVHTDDDEVELAWYIFTEKFKNENWHKLAIWFCEKLPLDIHQYNQEFLTNYEDAYVFRLGNDTSKSTYLIANTIYDGANLSDIREIKIVGTDLPNLIQTLKSYEFKEEIDYGFDVLKLLQDIIITENISENNTLFKEFSLYNMESISFLDGKKHKKAVRENDKTTLKVSEHLIEISVNDMSDFYNYYVIFDTTWASNYPELAESLIYFGSYNHL